MNMDFGSNRQQASFGRVGAVPNVTFDAGLRQFMQGVYSNMSVGLLITAVVSGFAGTQPDIYNNFISVSPDTGRVGMSGLGWIVAFAPLAFAFAFGMARNMSAANLRMMFFAFSAVMGLSLFSIFLTYTGTSIARTFFITSATFGATSLWGYTTKRDLTGMGHFMMMGMFGLIIASVVNIFMQSSALQFATSVIGVIIFTGLTAWDTQKLKQTYAEGAGVEANNKLAVFGALSLYMNFINLFIYLLRFFGERRE